VPHKRFLNLHYVPNAAQRTLPKIRIAKPATIPSPFPNQTPKVSVTALYIHIPFCHKLCPYCAFAKTTWQETLETPFIDALLVEAKAYISQVPKQKISSIFIGGGTPNALSAKNLDRLLSELWTLFDIPKKIEKTIELNPESLTHSHLKIITKLHINRASLGVQSFNQNELKFLGRTHHPSRIHTAVKMLRAHQISNFNLDLIFGTPSASIETLAASLDEALTLHPPHISTYALSIEQGTPFKRKNIQPLDQDTAKHHYQYLRKTLKKNKYIHYEVSAFSKPRMQCKHNLTYWNLRPFIGLGPSAASFFKDRHYHNLSSLEDYIQNPLPKLFTSPPPKLPKTERIKDYVVANLRRHTGISKKAFYKEFGLEFELYFKTPIQKLSKDRLLTQSKSHVKVTTRGLFLLDTVLMEFI